MEVPSRIGGDVLKSLTGEILNKSITINVTSINQYANGGAEYETDGSVDLSVLDESSIVTVTGAGNANNNGEFSVDKTEGTSVFLNNSSAVAGGSATITYNYLIYALHTKNIDGSTPVTPTTNILETKIISNTDISNGYVDLAHTPHDSSDILFFYDGVEEPRATGGGASDGLWTISGDRITFNDPVTDLYNGARIDVKYSY